MMKQNKVHVVGISYLHDGEDLFEPLAVFTNYQKRDKYIETVSNTDIVNPSLGELIYKTIPLDPDIPKVYLYAEVCRVTIFTNPKIFTISEPISLQEAFNKYKYDIYIRKTTKDIKDHVTSSLFGTNNIAIIVAKPEETEAELRNRCIEDAKEMIRKAEADFSC